MRVTSKGQVTIPIEIRRQLNILPETEVEFVVVGDEIRLRKVRGSQRRGRSLVAMMRGRATTSMTTDEILAHTRDEP